MDLNKEYYGSGLKIEISDLKDDVTYELTFKGGGNDEFIVDSTNWNTYVVQVDDKKYVIIPDETFTCPGILVLTIKSTTQVGTNQNYTTYSQPIPLVELVEQEAFLDTCDNCFSIYEHEGKVLIKCNMNCTGGTVNIYKNKSCEGLENELVQTVPFTEDGFACSDAPELEDGIYTITYKAKDNEDDYPVGDLYIYNNMIKDVVEDLKTILCNCGCPSCLECGEVDEDYMKHLLSNLNTLLIAYNDRLREPIKMVKEALKCVVLPSDLERKCIQISNDTKGDNPENNQFKKLGAFYYLVLAQDAINNLKNICTYCTDCTKCNITVEDLPDYFDYTNVIQCLRALGITYQIEIPEIDCPEINNNDTEEK